MRCHFGTSRVRRFIVTSCERGGGRLPDRPPRRGVLVRAREAQAAADGARELGPELDDLVRRVGDRRLRARAGLLGELVELVLLRVEVLEGLGGGGNELALVA